MASKLIFYHGTVSSSKTMLLLSVAFNYDSVGWNVVTIKPELDTRSEMIETRAHVPPRRADIILKASDSIFDYNDLISEADVILVDECQFLTEDQIDELRHISTNREIDVLCFGLRTDFNTHLFPASKRLFELADDIIEVRTICQVCGKHASFNKRVMNNTSEDIINPGWNNYVATCFKHYRE